MTEAAVLGLGWLQGTTRDADRTALLARLVELFGEAKDRTSGVQWYRQASLIGSCGVVLAWEPRSGWSPASELFVTVPQSALDALGWDGSRALLVELMDTWGLRPSRVDVYADDLSRTADPADVLAAIKAGNARTHVRTWRHIEDNRGGMTVYLGSRTGEAMVRVYRKWAESGDPAAGVRWEYEARGERAQVVADMMREDAGPRFVSLLRYFCDFVDRSAGGRGDRAPLLDWWAQLVSNVERAGVAVRRIVDTLERRREWVRRQVAPSLALLFAVDGSEGLSAMIADAWDRAPWHLRAPAPRWITVGGMASG